MLRWHVHAVCRGTIIMQIWECLFSIALDIILCTVCSVEGSAGCAPHETAGSKQEKPDKQHDRHCLWVPMNVTVEQTFPDIMELLTSEFFFFNTRDRSL